MMSLIARAPSILSSSASESLRKRSYESQSPLIMQTETYDRVVKPVVGRDTSHEPGHHHRFVESTYSASFSRWDDDKAWSSPEWKADELMDDRTVKPVVCRQRGAHAFHSRFSREHKHVILEEEENHDRTEKPVVCPRRGARGQQFVIGDDETELDLSLESRSFLDRVNDQVKKSSVSCTLRIFRFCMMPWKDERENLRANTAWEERLAWFKSSPEYRTLDRIDCETIEFEWNIFPGFTTLQLSHKVQELLLRLGETPENFTGRIIFMSMFNGISWRSKDNKKECESNAQLVSLLAKRFGAGQWSFLGPGSEKKWYSISEDSPQGEWEKMAEKMMIPFAESGHPVFEAIVQRSDQKQRWWKSVDPLLCRFGSDYNCFFAQLLL